MENTPCQEDGVLLRYLLSSVSAAALHSRCHDIEERVRLQAVHTVHEVAAQHMDLTPTQVGSHKT